MEVQSLVEIHSLVVISGEVPSEAGVLILVRLLVADLLDRHHRSRAAYHALLAAEGATEEAVINDGKEYLCVRGVPFFWTPLFLWFDI